MINKNINKESADEIGQEIKKAFFEDALPEWMSENSQGFRFDFRGRVDSIILAGGGPTIYIDLLSEPGYIIVERLEEVRGTTKLSDSILDEIIYFVEEYENAK